MTALAILAGVAVLEQLVMWAYDAIKLRWFTEYNLPEPDELPPF